MFFTLILQFICCFLVLGYLNELCREKKKKKKTALDNPSFHHFKIYLQWNKCRGHKHIEPCSLTHTQTHSDEESLAFDGDQNVECPRVKNLQHRALQPPCRCSVCTKRKEKGRSTSRVVHKTPNVRCCDSRGFLDVARHKLFYFMFSWEGRCTEVKDKVCHEPQRQAP